MSVSTFRTSPKRNVENEVEKFIKDNNLSINDIDLVLYGQCDDAKRDIYFTEIKNGLLKNIPYSAFKHLCGEYQTASSFGVWCATHILKEQKVPAILSKNKVTRLNNILVYNIYENTNHSLFLLNKIER